MSETLSREQLEEQLRFFKAAYGIDEAPPLQIMRDALDIVGCREHKEESVRTMRHIIAQGNRAEKAEKLAKRLHETVLKVSETVAHALDNAAADSAPRPPLWLLALGNELDMVLAEAALENR